MHYIIIIAILFHIALKKRAPLAAAVLSYLITTGILLWGIIEYSAGGYITLLGIELSQLVFFTLCLVWYAFDTWELIQVKKPDAQQKLKEVTRAFERGESLTTVLKRCDSLIQFEPNLAEAHNLRGMVLQDSNRLEEAIIAYREALRLKPSFIDAQENLSELDSQMQVDGEVRGEPNEGDAGKLMSNAGLGKMPFLVEQQEKCQKYRKEEAVPNTTSSNSEASFYRDGDQIQCSNCGKQLEVKYFPKGIILINDGDMLPGIALRCRKCGFVTCIECAMKPMAGKVQACPSCKEILGPNILTEGIDVLEHKLRDNIVTKGSEKGTTKFGQGDIYRSEIEVIPKSRRQWGWALFISGGLLALALVGGLVFLSLAPTPNPTQNPTPTTIQAAAITASFPPATKYTLTCDINAQDSWLGIKGEMGSVRITYNNEKTDYVYDSIGQISGSTVTMNRDLFFENSQHNYHFEGTITVKQATNEVIYDITATGDTFGNIPQTCKNGDVGQAHLIQDVPTFTPGPSTTSPSLNVNTTLPPPQGTIATAQLIVIQQPNPAKFKRTTNGEYNYLCSYKTSVTAVNVGITIQGWRTYFWENNQWIISTEFSAADFADWYSCPNAYIGPGQTCTDPQNWSATDTLEAMKAKSYYTGVDNNGNSVVGEILIECTP